MTEIPEHLLKRAQAARDKAAADEANRAIEIEVNASEQRKKDAEYIAGLKTNPACLLTDDDILRDNPSGAGGKKSSSRAK